VKQATGRKPSEPHMEKLDSPEITNRSKERSKGMWPLRGPYLQSGEMGEIVAWVTDGRYGWPSTLTGAVGSACLACLLPWRWMQYVYPEQWSSTKLHCIISQKVVIYIVTDVRTSNPALHLHNKHHPVNYIQGHNCCLLWKSYTHKYTVWAESKVF
jgi:hypothetical protein